MSLIESALEKLRRGGESGPEAQVSTPRPVSVPAMPKTPVGVPVPLPVAVPPYPEEPLKRFSLDFDALRTAGYLPQVGLERRFADHYRQIKRPLIEKALVGPADMRMILITSALPGDGKSFTSLNLALSMARERDLSVLLVDADTPRARISEVLGVRKELGLLDAVADESLDAESLILRTDVPGIDVLPAGRCIENATELLASERMSQIATRMNARNPRRVILFDSAPLLVSSEARVLLRIPGQIVLVARAGVTPRQALVEALTHVDRKKLQGVILNHAPFRKGGGYYDYGGYGAGDADAASPGRVGA